MKNVNEKGIYGQYNQGIETAKKILLQNKDLIKFLYYKDAEFDIRENIKYPYSKKIMEEVKKNQILNYNSLETRDANNYIIVDMGVAQRESKYENQAIDSNFVKWKALFYICSHEKYCETINGDRIRCIEQCIQDEFTSSEVEKVFCASISNSQPVSVADGYICRVVPVQMIGFNTSGF